MNFKAMLRRIFRKHRKTVEHRPAMARITLIHTIEGILLYNLSSKVYRDVQTEFALLPDGIRHRMTFSPRGNEWIPRAKWWRDFLYQVLKPREAAQAMQRIARWYRCCIRDLPREERSAVY